MPYYKVLTVLRTTLQYKGTRQEKEVQNAFSLQAYCNSKTSHATKVFINMGFFK